MRFVSTLLAFALVPTAVQAAGPLGRYVTRRDPHLEAFQVQHRGEVRSVRERAARYQALRSVDSDAQATAAGYESLAALRALLPQMEQSLVRQAYEIRLRSVDAGKAYREVREAFGAGLSATERQAISAEINGKKPQDADSLYWPLQRLAGLKQKVKDGADGLTERDRGALLREIDQAAAGAVVESKRYRELLDGARSKLKETEGKLSRGELYALHPLLQAKQASASLRRLEDFVPSALGALAHAQPWGQGPQPLFAFELSPDVPSEVRQLRTQIEALAPRAAVRDLRAVNSLLAKGAVAEAKKALDWLRPHVTKMKGMERLAQRVERHQARRIDARTAAPLAGQRARLAELEARAAPARRDPRYGKGQLMADLVQVYRESRDAALFGRGAALSKEAFGQLVAAAGEQMEHLYLLNDTVRRADQRSDAYTAFVAASAMDREAKLAAAALEPIQRDARVLGDAYQKLIQSQRSAAVMAAKRGQALDVAAQRALDAIWGAIRTGAANRGVEQARALSAELAAQPERPHGEPLARCAQRLQRIGERAPARRSKGVEGVLSALKRQSRGGDPAEVRGRAERLQRRVAAFADLVDRDALVARVDALLEHLRAEEVRVAREKERAERRLQRQKQHRPVREALARLRHIKKLLAADKLDAALDKLGVAPSRGSGAHAELLARRERALRTAAVQRKAEGLIAQAERLVAQREGRKARELAQQAQSLATAQRVDLDAAPRPKPGASRNLPGRPSLVRRLQRVLDATRPVRFDPQLAKAFRDLGLDPTDPLQATRDEAERAFRLIMKETRAIRTGEADKLPKAIADLVAAKAIGAQKAWREVIRVRLAPR